MFTASYPYYQPGQPALLPTPERVGALPAYTGCGVVIAFVDSGFYPHPDLAGRVLVHVDASTNRVIEQPPDSFAVSEQSWHGQMTSVIAAGDGHTSGGRYRGVASGAQLVLVKVSTPRGQVKERDILRGLRWIIDTHRRFNIRVVNLSVGGDFVSSDPDHPLHRAVRRLARAGVTVVAAVGNRAAPVILPPASAAEVIAVGGLDDHNTRDRARWTLYRSNYGTAWDGSVKPDLLAPAEWIAGPIMPETGVAREARWLGSLLHIQDAAEVRHILGRAYADLGLPRAAAQEPDANVYAMLQARINAHKIIDASHQYVDGTSVAAPIVAAVAAQMLEANPRLTPARICSILKETARPLPGIEPGRQGAGALDAAAAVGAALAAR